MTPKSRSIPVEYIQKCFEYREEWVDGILQGNVYWKYREDMSVQWNAKYAGKKAGSITSNGYYYVKMIYNKKSCTIKIHNIIWILHENRYPHDNMVIDHIDRNKTNNLLSNLRELFVYQNNLNSGPSNKKPSAYKGVYLMGNNWQAKVIKRDGDYIARTVFNKVVEDEIQAALLYNQEVVKHHDIEYVYLNDISNGYTNKEYPNKPRGWTPEKVAA